MSVLDWKGLGINEEYADQLECQLLFMDPLIEKIRDDKFSGSGKLKELYFLMESSDKRRYEWLRKAVITGVHHNIPGAPENTFSSFLILCKHQMKKDRENGVVLW